MPPKVKKLTSKEMLDEIKKNSELAKQSLMQHGMPKTTMKINEHALFRQAVECGHTDIVKLMIQKGCSVCGDPSKSYNGTPLHIAVEQQNLELVKLLLEKRVPLESVKNGGETVLHIAVKFHHLGMTKLLLQHGANFKAMDHRGKLVLHLAIEDHTATYNTGSFYSTKKPDVKPGTAQEIIQIIELFLQKGMAVDSRTKDGQTPLHFAVRRRMKPLVEFLLRHGASIHAVTDSKDSVLHTLVRDKENPCTGFYNCYAYYNTNTRGPQDLEREKAKVEFLAWLMTKGANVDLINKDGETALQLAARCNLKQVMRVLLQSAKLVDNLNGNQVSALFLLIIQHAKKSGVEINEAVEILEILLEKGAKVDFANANGETPVGVAAENNQKKILKVLLKHCTTLKHVNNQRKSIFHTILDMNAKNNASELKKTSEIVRLLLEKGVSADRVNDNGETPIHLAAKYKHKEILRIFLPRFTNVNACDKNKDSLLHIFLNHSADTTEGIFDDSSEYTEIVKTLIAKGAEVNVKNKDSVTPLQLAALHKLKDVAVMLMEHGANAQARSSDGRNALHFLCSKKMPTDKAVEREMVKLFIGKGCAVQGKTAMGMAPLHLAAQSGCDNIAEALIEHGASVHNTEPVNLATPLHVAAENNHDKVVEVLLKRGAQIDARQKHGMTALHMATKHRENRTVNTLLSSGADIEATEKNGKSPLHYACWYESSMGIDNLLQYGADINCKDKFKHPPTLFVSSICKEVQLKLLFHITKLKAANLTVSNVNNKCVTSFRDANRLNTFYATCLEEVTKLEEAAIDGHTSVYSILHMSPNKLSVYYKNVDFRKILYSLDFKDRFPIYGDLISAAYRRGIVRNGLMETAKMSLVQLIEMNMPESCIEKIFSFLNNKGLRDLIKSETVGVAVKRKGKDGSSQSAKRQKTE